MMECESDVQQLVPPVFETNLPAFTGTSKEKLGFDIRFTPELDLLLACIGIGESSKGFRRLLRARLDWALFLRLTGHHRLIPQVYGSLRDCEELVPTPALEKLREGYEASVRQSLRLTSDLLRVIRHFANREIAVMPYKGPALAAMLRIDFTERQFSDIDLLVRTGDVQRSKGALAELGYKTEFSLQPRQERSYVESGYEYSFDLPDGKNVLELKWRILPHFYSIDFDVAAFFDRSVIAEVAGNPMPTLCQEDLLLVLCAHAAKHAWSELSLIWDISRLLESRTFNWDCVFERANRLGMGRILRMNLDLSHRLLGIAPIGGTRESETTVVRERILPIVVEAQQIDTESISYFRLMLTFRERWRDRIRFLWRLISTPNQGEWSTVNLPPALFSLYHVVRICRLASRLTGRQERSES